MKSHNRVFAAIAVAVVLSLPSFAFAASPRERGGDKGPVVRIVQKIRKFFGITTHEEFPSPPIPGPRP